MPNNPIIQVRTAANARTSSLTQKWGGLASCLLAVSFFVAPLIYLVGDLRDALGPFGYDIADFLYGPVWAASLVTAVFALRERLGEHAPRRMSLALLAACLAAGAMVAVACLRSSNRQYHLSHPDLNLENSTIVLVVWATVVTGMNAVGWHFLGWALVLIGSAGWTSPHLPRVLSALYVLTGASALFVYLLPDLEGNVVMLGVVLSIWQGILLWKAESENLKRPRKVRVSPVKRESGVFERR